MRRVHIIGAGLAGLFAALTLAEQGISCNLISVQSSERAQSVLAEGGINAALNTMGEDDSPALHFADTVRGGCNLADPNAVYGLTHHAPEIVQHLVRLGVPFHMGENGLILRNFGGQKKKRTAYARSSTGKVIMTALIDAVRRYEASGLVMRYPHHEFLRLLCADGVCTGVRIRDTRSGQSADLRGTVLLCTGGMNGLFPGRTTGTTQNTADVTACCFAQGVQLGNPEMLQYHPTTIGIAGKRCLVTEAARGEGGRLYVECSGKKRFFMEEKYPELGNLMPRDVVAREMFFIRQDPTCGGQVYLDLTGLPEETWEKKLSDLREELMRYLGADPKTVPVPVEEGIHYFMGGLDADLHHRTNLAGLYAAGECACQYHGANRLGGNSMLGALYGGQTAAVHIAANLRDGLPEEPPVFTACTDPLAEPVPARDAAKIRDILLRGLGIVRDADTLQDALDALAAFAQARHNARTGNRILLAEAMLRGALARKESRGAHYRSDYPQQDEAFRRTTAAAVRGGAAEITFREIPELREADGCTSS